MISGWGVRINGRAFGALVGMAVIAVAVPGGAHAQPVSAPAAAAACAGAGQDFNGDGLFDLVVADPQATVDGVPQAGLVRVIYGGGKGTAEISQALPNDAAAPERGDQFGFSWAVHDADGDACADLVVGVPYEDVAVDGINQLDAGAVYVYHGSAAGLGTEGARIGNWTQNVINAGALTEANDLFGYALASGTAASGQPWLAIGVPGEDLTSDNVLRLEAGAVEYLQGSTVCGITQDAPSVPGAVEAYDRMGTSLTGTHRYFAVGSPGEAIGTQEFAGMVTVFSHTLESGCPKPLAGLDQAGASDGMPGTAEAGDQFGTSVSMDNYRPADQSYNSDAMLAIGIPGESIGEIPSAGMVSVVRVQSTGAATTVATIDATVADVEGDPASGDFFGQRVTLANTDASVVTGAATARLAVGIPGRDVGAVKDAGVVQVFKPLDASLGSSDKVLSRAASGSLLPGVATARDYLGTSLRSGPNALYVGVPYSKEPATSKGALYSLTWAAVDTGTGTATLYRPGAGGIPDAGTSFGIVG
ncbi:VCBS repeat-containing protein [Streptomyces sp. NPDC056296]|uniref:VCBS repeat-containing protein n=1 Tax=Streptomyces sp. NPDC056296 TaxID=3345775 RepID=UPI0035E3B4D6